jgi:hypothetical protein
MVVVGNASVAELGGRLCESTPDSIVVIVVPIS